MGRMTENPTRSIGGDDYPLREQVRDELRTRISDGRLLPGTRLKEQLLADEFRVSRIPVREALRMLQAEGLVEAVPRRGVVVSTLSRTDLMHLFDIRSALEVLAARLAAARATVSDVEKLEQLVVAARRATELEDHLSVIRLNAGFHEAVYEMAANPFLTTTLEPLMGRLRLMIGQSFEHEREVAEHSDMVAAIRAHDPEKAARIAFSHIQTSREHALGRYDAWADETKSSVLSATAGD